PQLLFLPAPAPPHIFTHSLHDALPISASLQSRRRNCQPRPTRKKTQSAKGRDRAQPTRAGQSHNVQTATENDDPREQQPPRAAIDRKSTRLNSSHRTISYAVFCLKKKR